MPTTFWAHKGGIVTYFEDRSVSELSSYLDKINKRLSQTTTRGEIDILNKLYWAVWFQLEKKLNEQPNPKVA